MSTIRRLALTSCMLSLLATPIEAAAQPSPEPTTDTSATAGMHNPATASTENPADALDAFMENLDLPPEPRAGGSAEQAAAASGMGNLRLIDIALDVLLAGGWSTETGDALQSLQGGGHDPHRRGFTVQNVELSLLGAIDPYLTGETHLVYFIDPEGESVFELEEAFATTTSLPYGLQVEAGQFFTEFGRLNPRHPHQWGWLDQPVINTRLFGPDGMRGVGLRTSWLTPLPWYSEVYIGVQNANGETMASFFASDEFIEGQPVVDRPYVARDVGSLNDFAYLARWVNGGDLADSVSTQFGLSALQGPNFTGARGQTAIYGSDLVIKWRSSGNFRGWPFLTWESEIMRRDLRAAEATALSPDERSTIHYPENTFSDWGMYTQLLYGFTYRWAAGLRYELADSIGEHPGANPFRNRRSRLSPLMTWLPSEFARLRLQYNYERAAHLDNDVAHSVWLGIEWLYGTHPAHIF